MFVSKCISAIMIQVTTNVCPYWLTLTLFLIIMHIKIRYKTIFERVKNVSSQFNIYSVSILMDLLILYRIIIDGHNRNVGKQADYSVLIEDSEIKYDLPDCVLKESKEKKHIKCTKTQSVIVRKRGISKSVMQMGYVKINKYTNVNK